MKKILLLVVTIVASIIAGLLIDKKWREGYLKANFDEMRLKLKKPYTKNKRKGGREA